MRTARTITILAVVAVAIAVVAPAAAYAAPLLTNDYGLSFAGQSACLSCHTSTYSATAHSRFVAPGALPSDPNAWPVTASNGNGLTVNQSDIAFTLGDIAGGSLTEYLTFDPVVGSPETNPFNVVEGLEWVDGKWELPLDGTGLYKGAYCGSRCHMVGAQKPGTGKTIPNTNVTVQPTPTTPDAWARFSGSDLTSLTTFVPGSSIQCELCHGTGVAADANSGGHWNSGVKIVGYGTNQYAKAASTKILDSQVCGQCHVTSSNVANTLGTVGYTPDQRLSAFITPKSATLNASYTASFESSSGFAAAAAFYPNGANKSMHHSYYNEWGVSAHSYRGRLSKTSTDALPYQKAGNGHYSQTGNGNRDIGCSKCHTGEGYLATKNSPIMTGYTLTTGTAGYYGQECQVCHYSHESGSAGLGVREPDAAGVRSAAGLATGNKSMCEDCHNWQMEIMGTTFNPTGGSVSHPMREVVEGRNIPDIPAMGEFMPGAKCEDCHMPVTHETRQSHSFKVMTPGDAIAWGVVNDTTLVNGNKGDSCSKCHAGETLDELQANIDKWQSDQKAAWAEATAALAAAQSRPASRTTDLDERAKTIISFATADGSAGAHNPPYQLAALRQAELEARAVGANFSAFDVSDPIFANGYGGFVAATLLDGAGVALADQPVDLFAGATKLSTVKTDANGNVAFRVLPTVTTSYHLVWAPRAGSTVDSGNKSIVVNKIPTTTTIKSSASTIYRYGYITLSGSIRPVQPGQTITIQRKIGTGAWTNLSVRTLSPTSGYSYYVKLSTRGTWYFRAIYSGNATYAGSTSASAKVVVK